MIYLSASLNHTARLPGGDNPLGYVVSKNLHRRHLTISQRGIMAAQLANWEFGINQYTKEGRSFDLPLNQSDAAKMMNVSVPTLKRAKKILDYGDKKIIQAINAGEMQTALQLPA